MELTIRAFGNSKGIVLPKALLSQAGLTGATVASAEVLEGAIVIKALPSVRNGWADAAAKVAAAKDDHLVMGEFSNAGDENLAWDDSPAPLANAPKEAVEW
ncbi:AbrB/MazE/SpoVT family DNA-binding domain-containing protein [Comamonas odontotermitis]|uniref:AbrB/MazE/SpoVT family DNA-binding domain-containing protein n=1 Tax=Comamonas odontotermitis TaxID=379895 RepID=UPI001CC81BE3|nr:AbrB/MazE/SpoVT family DNA-binding domain-containing protein [Comamonas odontotermitis]UBB15422.1 AbrB/MazE/SpoVT family DNA-binding domain-containing protein [Comamonas odontotermitis]